MMKAFYGYKINYYEESLKVENTFIPATGIGIVYASSFKDAINQITDYYGDEQIENITIQAMTELENTSVFDFKRQAMNIYDSLPFEGFENITWKLKE